MQNKRFPAPGGHVTLRMRAAHLLPSDINLSAAVRHGRTAAFKLCYAWIKQRDGGFSHLFYGLYSYLRHWDCQVSVYFSFT